MTDIERQALTLSLLGTGKPGDPPGPLNPGWVVRHLAGTRTTLQRWRKTGIPPERLDDVLDAVAALSPEQKEEDPPHWAVGLLSRVEEIYEHTSVSGPVSPADQREWMRQIAEMVAAWPTQSAAESDDPPDTEDRDVGAPGGRERG